MGKRRWLKRIFLAAVLFILCLAAALFTYPRWIGKVAGPVAKRFGAEFGSFERLENGRFALREVSYTNRAMRVEASRVEGYLPHVWYQRKGETNSEMAFLEVNGWKVFVLPWEKDRSKARTNRSVYGEFQKFERKLEQAKEWLPKATLLNGMIVLKGREYTLPLVTWANGRLEADGVWPENAIPVEIKARLAEEPYQISYAMHPLDLRVRLRLHETNEAVAANVTVFYKDNRAVLKGEFARGGGLLPEEASLDASEFKLPADLVELEGYRELTGSLTGRWISNQYRISLNAHADPFSERPPVDVVLEASGNTNAARIEKLLSTAPGLKLQLSDPVELSYAGKVLSGQSELAVEADLAKLPWGKLEGELEATVLLKPGGKLPVFNFRARGTNLSGFKFEAPWMEAAGEVEWPWLRDFRLNARLGTNGTIHAKGGADLRGRVLSGVEVTVSGVSGSDLPSGRVQFRTADLKAKASGPLTNLEHSAVVEVRDLVLPGMNPQQVEASWAGRMLAFDELALRTRAGPASLVARGSGYVDGSLTNFTFRELTLSKGEEPYLALEVPFNLQLRGGPSLITEELAWTGMDRELRLSAALGKNQGALQIVARNIHPELFQYFSARSLRGLALPALSLAANWSNGPVRGELQGEVALEDERFGQLRGRAAARLEQGGLMLSNLTVLDVSGAIVSARGFLPVSINPGTTNGLVKLSPEEEIDFQMETASSKHFWGVISELTKLQLSNPAARVELRGTVANPQGALQLAAEHIALRQTNRELPAAGPVRMQVTLNERLLRIPELEVEVEKQRLSLTGSVMLDENFWRQRREEITEYLLEHAALRVRATNLQVAPFARYLPQYVAPQGVVEIDAGVQPGRLLEGTVVAREIETRPLKKIGVIQGIEARLKLNAREIEVQNLSGVIGGQRLGIEGEIDLAEEHLAKGYPEVDLRIRGQNVPLARNPDVILRSDLDLRVTNGTNMQPMIQGSVNLQDSFLLRDIATLVPGRVATPERRPPFFSLPQDPIDEWRLDVRVRGENFMRVRSPFFQGTASANFHVIGTLEEPMALGEATISSGRVIFPFATLEVKQAFVSLTRENPYLPEVFVVAAGRAFGFDLRMQVEGFADEPVIEFSAVPALTSEQIILMLTTGQIPREDFGFSQEDRAGKLALFLGKSLWQKLNPGKAGEERLTVRSGEDITEQGRQTYEVEYKLSERWALVGEYDRFGALNANIKWRLLSR